MKEIQLTQGQVSKVCDCHYHLVKDKKWCAQWHADTRSFRAVRGTTILEQLRGFPRIIQMHVLINNTPKGLLTDHIDHDTLNNQCSNLRDATPSQNVSNRRKQTNNTSGFVGVYWAKHAKKWCARIESKGKKVNLGYFSTAEEAHQARNTAAKKLHGEFANIE